MDISSASQLINWETTPIVNLEPVLHLRGQKEKLIAPEVSEPFLVTSRPK